MRLRDRDTGERVVYVEREGGSGFGWFIVGAALGAGLSLLFAPRSGADTRKELGRRFDDLKEQAEEKFDTLAEHVEAGKEKVRARIDRWAGNDPDADGESHPPSAREELERRLTEARRRRRPEPEEEVPVA